MDVERVAALLQAVAIAEAAGESFDRRVVAGELGLSPGDLRALVQRVEGFGLVVVGDDEQPPVLTRAGGQLLRLGCEVDENAVGFLPRTIDDLFARRAFLRGGSVLVDTCSADTTVPWMTRMSTPASRITGAILRVCCGETRTAT